MVIREEQLATPTPPDNVAPAGGAVSVAISREAAAIEARDAINRLSKIAPAAVCNEVYQKFEAALQAATSPAPDDPARTGEACVRVPEGLARLSESATSGQWTCGRKDDGYQYIDGAGGIPAYSFGRDSSWSDLGRFAAQNEGAPDAVGEANAAFAVGAVNFVRAMLSAAPPQPQTGDGGGWQPIATAPKGYPALEEPSKWFLARGKNYGGPTDNRAAVIRRVFGVGFGPWQGTGDEYYKADFFDEWMDLPEGSLS